MEIFKRKSLVPLLPERASLGESGTPTGGLAQHRLAVTAHHNSLRVAKNGGDVEATLTFHVHEERIGRLNKTFKLVLPLLQLYWRIEQIDIVRKNHDGQRRIMPEVKRPS